MTDGFPCVGDGVHRTAVYTAETERTFRLYPDRLFVFELDGVYRTLALTQAAADAGAADGKLFGFTVAVVQARRKSLKNSGHIFCGNICFDMIGDFLYHVSDGEFRFGFCL